MASAQEAIERKKIYKLLYDSGRQSDMWEDRSQAQKLPILGVHFI